MVPPAQIPAFVCFALFLATGLATSCFAEGGESTRGRHYLEADRFIHDDKASTLAAEGNVELRDGGRILRAERMAYNMETGFVIAEGEVSLVEADGTVYQAEAVEVSDDLREGALQALVARFPNGATLVAESAKRTADGQTSFERSVYTLCQTCEDAEDSLPPWRVLARTSTHDLKGQEITHRGVTFETFGVPVFYLPYLRLPDNTVERKSGFLFPVVRIDDILGFVYKQPYFFDIDPHQDILFEPIWTSGEGPVLTGTWRKATPSGDYRIETSLTRGSRLTGNERQQKTRGHVDIKASLGLGNGWQTGVDIVRASDRSYLARYGFDRNINVLTQYAFLRKRGGPLRADVELYGFQNLSDLSESKRVPQIFPRVRVRWDNGLAFAGRLVTEFEIMSLAQDDGRRSRRLSLQTTWSSGTTINGHVLDISALAREDFYDSERGRPDPSGAGGDPPDVGGFKSRFVPQIEAGWRFPLVRSFVGGNLILEPVIRGLARDGDPNPASIPNTDSAYVQLTHVNLFDDNRFPGLDRIESGIRLNYGLRGTYLAPGRISVRGVGGGVTRLKAASEFDMDTGLFRSNSDLVGGLAVDVENLGSAYYAVRLDRSGKRIWRSQLGINARIGPVRGDLSYVRIARDTTLPEASGDVQGTEQGRLRFFWEISEQWRLYADHSRDFTRVNGNGTLNTLLGLEFQNECIRTAITFQEEETSTSDVPPTTTIGFKVEIIAF